MDRPPEKHAGDTVYHAVRVDRISKKELRVASTHTKATWAGRAAAREAYRQGWADAIAKMRESLIQLEGSDPGPISDQELAQDDE
ncbi:hypothetical protein [Cryptosporangium sp. NPDC048952]|uniref:hypothetical protein n=1 Tax=Cryptosporangium sp. NPDC048952 TaxID=3363961 RepID=UPI00371AB953